MPAKHPSNLFSHSFPAFPCHTTSLCIPLDKSSQWTKVPVRFSAKTTNRGFWARSVKQVFSRTSLIPETQKRAVWLRRKIFLYCLSSADKPCSRGRQRYMRKKRPYSIGRKAAKTPFRPMALGNINSLCQGGSFLASRPHPRPKANIRAISSSCPCCRGT